MKKLEDLNIEWENDVYWRDGFFFGVLAGVGVCGLFGLLFCTV